MNTTNLSFLDTFQIPLCQDVTAFNDLADALFTIWQQSHPGVWNLLRYEIMEHPIKALLHEDPFTRRCYDKPRGYAGDPVLLDYMYGYTVPTDMSDFGKALFKHITQNQPLPRAVRYRSHLIGHLIDKQVKAKGEIRVLSIACGHLREAYHAKAVKARTIAEFIAVDQDGESLALVDQEFGRFGVKTIHHNLKDILRGQTACLPDKFDFIYASGLYDYLPQGRARRLTNYLFELLQPGGTLFISGFLPVIPDVGYMETFMDWCLIYRDIKTLLDLSSTLAIHQIRSRKTFIDPDQIIGFLEITKA
jgi:extracellular factor (EF) 3-hydroxypalmitic acid methyl ester biosynthesis protein